MRKLKLSLVMILVLVPIVFMSGCVITFQPYYPKPENQTLTFVKAKFIDYYHDGECVGLFFDYTNDSGGSKSPGTEFFIGACQKEKVLSSLWLSNDANEEIGAIGAATSVPTGTTVRVVYLFCAMIPHWLLR